MVDTILEIPLEIQRFFEHEPPKCSPGDKFFRFPGERGSNGITQGLYGGASAKFRLLHRSCFL